MGQDAVWGWVDSHGPKEPCTFLDEGPDPPTERGNLGGRVTHTRWATYESSSISLRARRMQPSARSRGDAGCRYHYCSNLLYIFALFESLIVDNLNAMMSNCLCFVSRKYLRGCHILVLSRPRM